MLCFLVGALSTIGLPPFGGAWSKWFLVQGTIEAHDIAFLVVLLVSSLLNIAYLLPIPLVAFFGREPQAAADGEEHPPAEHGEAPLLCRIPIIVTAIGCLLLFFWPRFLHDLAALAAN
jgi:multicomponent Na+:H+ antiporter subunit D